jgi:hypothetical protein
MAHVRRARGLAVVAAVAALLVAATSPAGASQDKQDELRADLDGKPIELAEVGNWYCHDFDYPAIHCFSDPQRLEDSTRSALRARKSAALVKGDVAPAAAGVTYVTVYEFTTYQGAFMHMSQDYSLLSLIGWNDRISAFKVRNSQSGAFWTDWLYTGTRYNFCCNQELGSLGGFNDTFSSVFRN